VTIPPLFVHGLCCYFWVLEKGMLISFPKDRMLILVFVFKVELRWATLVDYPFDVLAFFIVDVGRYLCEDGICIPVLTDIFPFDVADNHACVKSIVDSAGGSKSTLSSEISVCLV
jgi:hypothetical protein